MWRDTVWMMKVARLLHGFRAARVTWLQHRPRSWAGTAIRTPRWARPGSVSMAPDRRIERFHHWN